MYTYITLFVWQLLHTNSRTAYMYAAIHIHMD